MKNIYDDRINSIRVLMEFDNVDAYFVPMDDCHNSEYVSDHFKAIEFLSGFKGSAGQMVITKDQAFLWTDGRYFLQAEEELKGSSIVLMKMGEIGVPKVIDFLNDELGLKKRLGFDGKNVTADFADNLICKLKYNVDYVGEIWKERPGQEFSSVFSFEKQSGESVNSKLKKIRKKLEKKAEGDYAHVINTLDDIAWIFNFRADDVMFNPVAYAYAVIKKDDAELFLGTKDIPSDFALMLNEAGVRISDYKKFQKNPMKYIGDEKTEIILDKKRISCDMFKNFEKKKYKIICMENPSTLLKSRKNDVEIEGTKEAHLKDGAVLVKLIKWLKENVGKEKITECDVDEKLKSLRKSEENFIEHSFGTISAYKENAAVIHYEPERGKDKELKPEGFLLLDSGAHYLEGTTDITRTISLGPLSEKEKKFFTLVAASMLRVMNYSQRNAKQTFNQTEADKIARNLLNKEGIDYNHGTGHGIGHVLNVHEHPPVISKKKAKGRAKAFKQGQITSDEPGVYFEGEFGVRIENDLLVAQKKDKKGNYFGFENLTFVPIDIDAIDLSVINKSDLKMLNNYNQKVYNALKDRLDEETRNWLKENTKPLGVE